jgi:hypothetical protein
MLQRSRAIAGDWWSTWERSTRGGLDARSADHTRLGRGYGASIKGKVQNRATDLGWAELPSVLRWFKGARVLTPIRYTHPASRHRAAREGSGCRCGRVPPCVPQQRHDHDQDARDAPRVSRQRAQPPALRNLRNEKVSLTSRLRVAEACADDQDGYTAPEPARTASTTPSAAALRSAGVYDGHRDRGVGCR